MALSAKLSSSNTLFSTPKKQSNSLQIDLFSKLANNNKLTSDEHKKYLENNIYLYCSTKDYKLDFYPKKQIIVTLKNHSTSATTDLLVVAFKKSLEKQRVTLRTLHRLKAMLNFPV